MSGFLGKLPRKISVKELVLKSVESSVLAVEVYNKPTVQFRTGAYASLMVIAWTAALHAVFEREGVSYYYKKRNGRFERIDGDKRAWELLECVKKYGVEKIGTDVAANLRLFAKLRNKIEHRQMATLDAHVAAECQALLLNLKNFLSEEFGIELLGDMGLYIPISVFSAKRVIPQSAEEKAVIQFVDKFRASLDPHVWNGTNYAFRAFLMPRIGNHQNSSDVTIEFLKLEGMTNAQKERATKLATMIRDRQVPMRGDLLKPKAVVQQVKEHHPEFTMNRFANAWKALCIRPINGAEDPSATNTRFCHYDPVDEDYRYEPEYVEELCRHLEAGNDFTCPDPVNA
ncbi:DUF3644 domain-containing protein [Ruegeria arenilitoris]|uniref:DUF3644 domain-containing protein n=1 Tax=Ruegeria arenilitoris TaxID=1173585 RepID=UPI00147D8CF5|nr:DUF3644 domain-containing protein [Ruegeria arenilitoris]